MSRAAHDYPRRGCSIGSDVTVAGSSFAPVEVEEIQAVIRFWRRRAYHSFVSVDAPNGETDFEINLGHLTYALGRIHYYEQLLETRK
jgi:hypothetical protein